MNTNKIISIIERGDDPLYSENIMELLTDIRDTITPEDCDDLPSCIDLMDYVRTQIYKLINNNE